MHVCFIYVRNERKANQAVVSVTCYFLSYLQVNKMFILNWFAKSYVLCFVSSVQM